jgi:hypothetical protein
MALGAPIALVTGGDTTFTQELWFLLLVVSPPPPSPFEYQQIKSQVSVLQRTCIYNQGFSYLCGGRRLPVKVFKKCKVAYQNIHFRCEISQFTICAETYR